MSKRRSALWKSLAIMVFTFVNTISTVCLATFPEPLEPDSSEVGTCFKPGTNSLPSFRVTSLHQWVVDRMSMWAPPGISYVEEAKESKEEGRKRYEDIANDIISVTYDPAERPIFQGVVGRAMTTALLTSIAFYESAYRKDVDAGIGPKSRGDSGHSWCLMQIKLGSLEKDGRTKLRVLAGPNGGIRFISSDKDPNYDAAWDGRDLVQDRTKCFRVAVRIARLSFGACSKLEIPDRLSAYVSGRCELGNDASRRRVHRAQGWLWGSPPPTDDVRTMDLLWSDIPPPSGEESSLFVSPDKIVQTWFM